MNHDNISYSLAKQVPDMVRGFTISTNYGDMVIEPGWIADQIIASVKLALCCELFALEQPTPVTMTGRDHFGFTQEANVIGETYVRHPEPQPDPEESCGPLVAGQCPLCLRELTHANSVQAGGYQ